MDLQLKNKSIIVCASSSGLGRATALEFMREGANVMLASTNENKLRDAAAEIKEQTGREPKYTVTDLTRTEDIAGLVHATVSAFGGVYALVNNTGGPPAGMFDQFDDAAWQKAYELTLLSYIRATREVLPHMRKGGEGRIVSFTSSSIRSPLENLLLSNTFRMGVVGFSKTLANEVGGENILVNVLAPGKIYTERVEHLDGIRAKKTGVSVEQLRENTCKTIPLGRYGTPEEYAKMAVFLASPANSYITGQAVLVDGGMGKAY